MSISLFFVIFGASIGIRNIEKTYENYEKKRVEGENVGFLTLFELCNIYLKNS